jgi:hypothetical protein
MLRLLRLADQYIAIERGIVDEWSELRLEVTVADQAHVDRAATLLAPTNPGRLGRTIRFSAFRLGRGISTEGVRRLLARVDAEGIQGELKVVDTEKAPPPELRKKEELAGQWERALGFVPSDWSDLYAEVRLDSSDYLERAALMMAPLNPVRHGGAATFRFRCAHHFGYGAAAGMAARCLDRCDDEGITGEVTILHVLSDTEPVATQGPVWLLDGRVV